MNPLEWLLLYAWERLRIQDAMLSGAALVTKINHRRKSITLKSGAALSMMYSQPFYALGLDPWTQRWKGAK